jgi:adenosylcobinamide-GDP ribazoletransferase
MIAVTAELAQGMRHFLLAIQFFTRLPITGRLALWVGYSPEMLRASVGHFPAVGYLVGAVAALVWLGVMWATPPTPHAPLLAAALSTVATLWLTGGFHEDGLADVADGLGGHVSRERALDIMKDSRIGAYGAMALVMMLLTKVSVLAVLGTVLPAQTPVVMWLAHIVSRTCPLLTIRSLPHVGDAAGSKSKPLADQVSGRSLAVAGLWLLLALSLYLLAVDAINFDNLNNFDIARALLMGGLGALLGWFWVWHLLKKRLGGFTGDGLGTTQQLAEAGFLLGVLWAC